MNYIRKRWRTCTALELEVPIEATDFGDLVDTLMNFGTQPSQLRSLHLITTRFDLEKIVSPHWRDVQTELIEWLLCRVAATLEILNIEALNLSYVPAPSLSNVTELSLTLTAKGLVGIANTLPLLHTLKILSLRSCPARLMGAELELLLADMPHLHTLKLRDIVPAKLELREDFHGLHVSLKYGAYEKVWERVTPMIVAFEWAASLCIRDLDRVPGIARANNSFDSLVLSIANLGSLHAPMRFQGSLLQSKHVAIWANDGMHAIVPARHLGWERVFIHSNETLNITFEDLPAFAQSPVKFHFKFWKLQGSAVTSLGNACGRFVRPWHAEDADGTAESLSSVANFWTPRWKPCLNMLKAAPVIQATDCDHIYYDCMCKACLLSLEACA